MSSQKNQSSSDKKPKSKKDYSKSNKKITDFFSNFQNVSNSNCMDDISSNHVKNENTINLKEEEDIQHKEKFIDLFNGDNSNTLMNSQNIINNKKIKKKKMEDKNSNLNHSEMNHFGFNSKKNNILFPSYFINLNTHSYSDDKRNLILADLFNDKINLHKLNITPNNFQNIKDYHKSFPFQNCRIININNNTFLIGGILNDEISKLNHNNEVGIKNCFKLIYNKETKEIKIFQIPSTIYGHQSHALLFLPKYNTIVVCSGHQQKNCEYLDLKNNGMENKWERLCTLRKVRENAIPLLFNDKYIFLIGGSDINGNINQDYDVLNFDVFINGKYQNYWKTYSIENNNYELFKQKGSGIIYYNNNIYILGGFNSKKEFFSWKIIFEEDNEDNKSIFIKEEIDKNYKINSFKSCDIINKYILKSNNINSFSFCGDGVFMNYKDYFINISFGGQLNVIPKLLLN